MKQERFRLALEQLDETNWSDFERLASTFLVAEFPNLRTVASLSGDGGRDSEIFSPTGDPAVLLQYSVTEDWRRKVRQTARRIAPKKPTFLVYLSNQEIGAKGDGLQAEIHTSLGFRVDIRDRHWFLERVNTTPEREAVAEDLAVKYVDPLLADKGLFRSKATAMTSEEAKTAFVYLGLQWEDDSQEKGLTKIAFDALVCSALHGTDPESRVAHAELLARVRRLLPTHPEAEVDRRTVSAIGRLVRRRIRYTKATNDYCLAFEERIRLTERLLTREIQERDFLAEIGVALDGQSFIGERARAVEETRRLLERFLCERGEQFARSAVTGTYKSLDFQELNELVLRSAAASTDRGSVARLDAAGSAVKTLLTTPGPAVQSYLRTLADTYTLFAFLRETPDVQAVVSKMFWQGDIWLDTSILLPALAEILLEDETQRRVTRLLSTASEAGLRLHVIDGVLEEVERHMNRALTCARTSLSSWEGSIPFLFSMFVALGRNPATFSSWLETFRGPQRPVDDIVAYLNTFFQITRTPLDAMVAQVPEQVRHRVQELWQAVHEQRRSAVTDPMLAHRLAAHDTENYLGVLERRRGELNEPFGFKSWLLTLDRKAYAVDSDVRAEFPAGHGSPLLSPDFLSNYLSFGPIRRRISREMERTLPIIIDASVSMSLPREIVELAEQKRRDLDGLPEYRIQREVRDAVDSAKRRQGPIARDGLRGIEDDLRGKAAEAQDKRDSSSS
jgi:hypothetical protein